LQAVSAAGADSDCDELAAIIDVVSPGIAFMATFDFERCEGI